MKITLGERLFGRGRWIQTFDGARYYPVRPHADEVSITDIAHHLSMLCRFTGAVDRFYSVAEHCWHVSYLVSRENALKGLLHDAPEAYTNDLSRPVKHSWLLWGYRCIEQRNWLAVAEAFGLTPDMPPDIHDADARMLTVERAALLKVLPWSTKYPVPLRHVKIMAWRPDVAERMFIQRFHELTARRPQHPAELAERNVPTWHFSGRWGCPA